MKYTKANPTGKGWDYGHKLKKTRQGKGKNTKFGKKSNKKHYIKKYRGQGK